MTALKFSGPVLGEQGEEVRDLYVVDGRITFEPQPGAETAGRGWIVPGLVDAHNHLGLEDGGAVGEEETLAQALADRDTGALLLRDCGRHPLGPGARGPAAPDPRRAAHRAHEALHPQLRARGRAGRPAGVCRPGGAAR